MTLFIECIAELQCSQPWHQIRHALDKLQVAEFFDLYHRVVMRNEIPAATRKILQLQKITAPKQVVEMAKHPQNLQTHAESRSFCNPATGGRLRQFVYLPTANLSIGGVNEIDENTRRCLHCELFGLDDCNAPD